MQQLGRKLVLAFVRATIGTFYRIQILGQPVPTEGPVILVANHPNGLVDPCLLLQATRRRIFFLGKEPLLRMPLIGLMVRSIGLIPVYRSQDGADTGKNASTFEAVFRALEGGDLVGLFPEGRSHDEPANQRLKTGAARMALGADPRSAGEPKIVPVGLVYARKGAFRSRVAVWIGEAVDGCDLRAEADAAGGGAEPEWASVEALTARIDASLATVTVNLDQWEDWPLLRLAERIWHPARGTHRVQRLGGLSAAARQLRREHPEEAAVLARRIGTFRQTLQGLGLKADHLDTRYPPTTILRFALRHTLALVLGVPLVALVVTFWLPPFLLIAVLLPLLRPAPDLVSTYKLLGGMIFGGPWLLAAACGLGWMTAWWAGVLLAVVALPAGRLAMRVIEGHLVAWRELRAFARIMPARRMRERLIAERDAIAGEIDGLTARLASEPAPTP